MIYKNEPNASQVLNNLWLGNYLAAHDNNFIKKNNIRLIINCTKYNYDKIKNIHYINLPLEDNNANGAFIIKKNLNNIVSTINQYITNGYSVLIHCKSGHKRSALITVLYLNKSLFKDMRKSIDYVKSVRKYAFRNECKLCKYFF